MPLLLRWFGLVEEDNMCLKTPAVLQPATVEEIIAKNSASMTDDQKAEYAYELYENIFNLLTNVVGVEIFTIDANALIQAAQAQYPSLTDIKLADTTYQITTPDWLPQILEKDWTRKIKYSGQTFDCDKFANELYSHMCFNYGLDSIFPVWGDTTNGYHGFNLAVMYDKGNDLYVARLIEPQTGSIFIDQGPLGVYTPKQTAVELGIVPPSSGK